MQCFACVDDNIIMYSKELNLESIRAVREKTGRIQMGPT